MFLQLGTESHQQTHGKGHPVQRRLDMPVKRYNINDARVYYNKGVTHAAISCGKAIVCLNKKQIQDRETYGLNKPLYVPFGSASR